MKKTLLHGGVWMYKLMRITVIQATIAMTLAGMVLAHDNNGQEMLDKKVTCKYEGVSLKRALNDLERLVGVKFAYSGSNIKLNDKVTLAAASRKLGEVLDEMLHPREIEYSVQKDYIVLTHHKDDAETRLMETLEKEWVRESAAPVNGEVVDEQGNPMPGVNILVKGTTTGTVTDLNGRFSLDVSMDAALVVSFVGYKPLEISVNGQSFLRIQMEVEVSSLDEVVVVGYTTAKKSDLTGAISVVELNSLGAQARSSGNVMQALQGRVPGLFIEKSGNPSGATSRILIRGASTLGNNNPLYVIDGVPTTQPEIFSSLNPDVIESIQVLKDAASSSQYGSRAANGVIIVTTKGGPSQGETVNVTINSNISVLSEKPQRYDMLDASQMGEVIWRASINDRTNPANGFGQLYDFDWNGDFDNPVLFSVTRQPFIGGDPNVPSADTDWQDASYKTGYVYNNEVSVVTSSEKSSLLLNFGHMKNTGILKYTDYERYSAKLNASTKLFKDKLQLGVNTQFSISNETQSSRDVGSAPTPALAISYWPNIPVYDKNGAFAGPIGAGYSDRNNPVLMQYLNRWDNIQTNLLFGNVFGELTILEDLVLRSSIGLNFNTSNVKDIETKVQNGFVNRAYNRLILNRGNYSSLTFTNTLDYQAVFNEHRFRFLLGMEAIKTDQEKSMSQADDFAVEDEFFFVLDAATGTRLNSGSATGHRLISQFFKLDYGYENRYLASLTIRRDGSSRFGQNNRYGFFPSATVGWRINNEEFFEDIDFVSNLKLRVGYGVVGNQEIGDLARFGLYETRYGPTYAQVNDPPGGFYNNYMNVGSAYDIGANNSGNLRSGFVSIQAPNPDLKWESTREWDLGIDFGFFENRFTGSFDYYTRVTSDILTTPPIASVVGEGQQRVLNGATIETKGWELALNYNTAFGAGWHLGILTNFGAFENVITELPEEVRTAFPGTAENSIIGRSQFSIFGYRTDGLFQSTEEVNAHPNGGVQISNARPGGIRIVDLNNDGVINPDDRDFIGVTLPELEFGMGFDLNYKGFDLSAYGSGVLGRIGLDGYIIQSYFAGGMNNGVGTLNAWTPTNADTDVPALSLVNNLTGVTSDYLYRNNSYFKIRTVQVGYNFKGGLMEKIGILRGIRVYAQGENLFWFTAKEYVGSDPERTSQITIPLPRVISLGLTINL